MNDDLLMVRSQERLVGLPVGDVEETMRPLRREHVPGVPSFVRGVSLVRGAVTPVLDLGVLLGGEASLDPRRMVTIRTEGSRRVGLLVDSVLGVRSREAFAGRDLPPLLSGGSEETVAELMRLDNRLVTVLRASRLVPEDLVASLSTTEMRP